MGASHTISPELIVNLMIHTVQPHMTFLVPVSALSVFPYTSFFSPLSLEWFFRTFQYSAQASIPRCLFPGPYRLSHH